MDSYVKFTTGFRKITKKFPTPSLALLGPLRLRVICKSDKSFSYDFQYNILMDSYVKLIERFEENHFHINMLEKWMRSAQYLFLFDDQ